MWNASADHAPVKQQRDDCRQQPLHDRLKCDIEQWSVEDAGPGDIGVGRQIERPANRRPQWRRHGGHRAERVAWRRCSRPRPIPRRERARGRHSARCRWCHRCPRRCQWHLIQSGAKPTLFSGVNASFRIAAARIATISGITPGNRAPAWAAGANSKPAFTSRTMGAPQPITMAATPIHPRRSSAETLAHRRTAAAASLPRAKRIAAISHGVRLVVHAEAGHDDESRPRCSRQQGRRVRRVCTRMWSGAACRSRSTRCRQCRSRDGAFSSERSGTSSCHERAGDLCHP